MAFSAAQKRDIRKYLGVPFGFYDLNTRLESMIDLVGNNATDQAEIETWLTRLAAIDTALTGSSTSTSAEYGSLKKVEEVEFYPIESDSESDSFGDIERGRVLIGRLARALGMADVLPYGDYFSASRPMGFTIALG